MLQLLSAFGAFWIALGFVMYFLFVFFVPFAVFRVMRNSGRIATELERLNSAVESGKLNITFTITDKSGPGEALRHVAGAGAGPLKL